ncbi:MAG: hypothetical protein EOM12_05750 [Verrucomicrobiae bacterium]|nr:hypothetical protein [Verrucomicrobiae bacterium]
MKTIELPITKKPAVCKKCKAEIYFHKTESGKWMVLEATGTKTASTFTCQFHKCKVSNDLKNNAYSVLTSIGLPKEVAYALLSAI